MFKPIHKLSAGFSMIEMLIALLILSIGLLGVATLQTRGQQFNQVGYLRTQATFLAYDIMDRMRINVGEARNGNYAQDPMPETLSQNCDSNDCTSQELTTYDLVKWYDLLEDTLPEGNSDISWGDIDNNGINEYTITIQWANIINREEDAEQEEQTWTLQL